ncbi:MAG: hypothetical protein KatS3mg111_3584 [Pirellulaceae bacterium]|nr:MAG: hypothetical protein KatS3mg111_3584 [Pirellulaceae bacterium]
MVQNVDAMFRRLHLIREFGGPVAYRATWVVLLGSILLPVWEYVAFQSLIGAAIVGMVTLLAAIFRRQLLRWGSEYRRWSRGILWVYALVLLATRLFGYGHHVELLVIIAATAMMFNLNYWVISEAALLFDEESPAAVPDE